MTIGFHLPSAIRRPDEAINCVGGGGVAKNIGMVRRINSVQATRPHRPALATALVAAIIRSRRSSAKDAQGRGGDYKRDESLLFTHGGFLLLPDATRCESMAH